MRRIFIFLFLIVAGCAGTRSSTERTNPVLFPEPFYDTRSVIDSVWANALPTSLNAEGALSMKTPLYSGMLQTQIIHRRADSLLMVLRLRGLGIEGARFLVTRDSIFLYDRFSQTVRTGSSSDPAFPAIFSVQNAIEQLLGLVRPIRGAHLQLTPSPQGLILEDTILRRTYTIDPEYWRVIHVTQQDSSGDLYEAFHFNDFFAVGKAYFPRQVIYRNPSLKTNVILDYRSISVNEPVISMSLDLPAEVERIRLSGE